MELHADEQTGLELILCQVTFRYVWDSRERIVADAAGGVPPHFLLGRAEEGCLWRFRADLADDLVRSVAKLAGRERGCAISETSVCPERLEMIARLLGADPGADVWERETFEIKGKIRAELWTFVDVGAF